VQLTFRHIHIYFLDNIQFLSIFGMFKLLWESQVFLWHDYLLGLMGAHLFYCMACMLSLQRYKGILKIKQQSYIGVPTY
jgi:hypothetical protein